MRLLRIIEELFEAIAKHDPMRASDAMLLHIVHNRSAIDDLEKVDFES